MTVDSNGTTAKFLPTPSARRATLWDRRCTISGTISTHALREEGDASALRQGRPYLISTHALREEGDCRVPDWWSSSTRFLPTPSARRATGRSQLSAGFVQFLPTPSARRATVTRAARALSTAYFYPRPPRGGRQWAEDHRDAIAEISTHALREEGDLYHHKMSWSTHYFYPRPPRGGRRRPGKTRCRRKQDFYPRPPRGGRPRLYHRWMVSGLISTHALREEGDLYHHKMSWSTHYFYPRPPRGGRHGHRSRPCLVEEISTHALREEGDVPIKYGPLTEQISTHALREEGDPSG